MRQVQQRQKVCAALGLLRYYTAARRLLPFCSWAAAVFHAGCCTAALGLLCYCTGLHTLLHAVLRQCGSWAAVLPHTGCYPAALGLLHCCTQADVLLHSCIAIVTSGFARLAHLVVIEHVGHRNICSRSMLRVKQMVAWSSCYRLWASNRFWGQHEYR
jgi:hypothetical protein